MLEQPKHAKETVCKALQCLLNGDEPCWSSLHKNQNRYPGVKAVKLIYETMKENFTQKHVMQFSIILFLAMSTILVPNQKLFSATG